ncbi:MAG: PstS family phosphate ABC transporter substrate-binding protein [Elusimicrobiota bacterium]|jgi:phosphate transport system substrate-binding protein|nr:PstS family phosphate ABC transporter substrate-binding protein [Elusimicrobiota bacterium]
MKRFILSILVGLLSINFIFAFEEITVSGSTTVLPIAQAASEDYMNTKKDISISVRGGGSGVGITSLIDGRCDIANSSRKIKDKEILQANQNGIKPKEYIIAMDGIAVIVNQTNPIKNLTKEQLKSIFTGKTSNWAEVGGKNQKIVVVSRDSASGTFEAFNTLVLDEEKVREDALLDASNKGVATIIEKTPSAIGYIGIAYLSKNTKAVDIDSITCSKQNVLNNSYPLSRNLYMYTIENPKTSVKDFINFILSQKGQKIVTETGYIAIK